MNVAQIIVAGFGLLIIIVVLWNVQGPRRHGEGDDNWQYDGSDHHGSDSH